MIIGLYNDINSARIPISSTAQISTIPTIRQYNRHLCIGNNTLPFSAMQAQEFTSVFDQIAPRCYVSVAHFFRTSADQDMKSISGYLQQAVQRLITIQPCLGGVLSEDDTAFIRFHPRPTPQLGDIEIRELEYRQVSFADLENKHYGPTYCYNPELAVPNDNPFVPVFRVAICWFQDGFALLAFLHHTIADGLSCQYLIELLAAVTREETRLLPRHRQLRLGEPTWKSTPPHRHTSTAPVASSSSSTPTTPAPSSRNSPQQEVVQFDQNCVYTAQGCESGPLTQRGTLIEPGRLTQLLVQVVPTHGSEEDASCTRFCRRTAQMWILTMASRDRAGRFQRRYETSTVVNSKVEEEPGADGEEVPLTHLIFAVGLHRAEDELGSRAVYSRVSYPLPRLIKALDDPGEVRKVEVQITKAFEAARQPRFHTAIQSTFENYFRDGGDPSQIQLDADLNDPYVFFFNTWRFMGKTRDRITPICWKFPCFSAPRAPDCIRKITPSYGHGPYGLVQPSPHTHRDIDDILITLDSDDARHFTALVSERGHTGVTSSWEVLDMAEQSA